MHIYIYSYRDIDTDINLDIHKDIDKTKNQEYITWNYVQHHPILWINLFSQWCWFNIVLYLSHFRDWLKNLMLTQVIKMPGPAITVKEHSLRKIFVHKGTVVRYSLQDFFFLDAISFRIRTNVWRKISNIKGLETLMQPTESRTAVATISTG